MNDKRNMMLLWCFLLQVPVMYAIRPERSMVRANRHFSAMQYDTQHDVFNDKRFSVDAFEKASNRACIRTILTSICVIGGSLAVMLLTSSSSYGE